MKARSAPAWAAEGLRKEDSLEVKVMALLALGFKQLCKDGANLIPASWGVRSGMAMRTPCSAD